MLDGFKGSIGGRGYTTDFRLGSMFQVSLLDWGYILLIILGDKKIFRVIYSKRPDIGLSIAALGIVKVLGY
jgi:hypothetical protein